MVLFGSAAREPKCISTLHAVSNFGHKSLQHSSMMVRMVNTSIEGVGSRSALLIAAL